jgi:hypothetical protein
MLLKAATYDLSFDIKKYNSKSSFNPLFILLVILLRLNFPKGYELFLSIKLDVFLQLSLERMNTHENISLNVQ